MCSGMEAGSYLRLIDFAHHSTIGGQGILVRYSLYRSAHSKAHGIVTLPVLKLGDLGSHVLGLEVLPPEQPVPLLVRGRLQLERQNLRGGWGLGVGAQVQG